MILHDNNPIWRIIIQFIIILECWQIAKKILLPVVFLFRRYSSHSSISVSIGKQHMFYSIAVVNKENKEGLHLAADMQVLWNKRKCLPNKRVQEPTGYSVMTFFKGFVIRSVFLL